MNSMNVLVLATRNPHKLEEIRALFPFPDLITRSALDYPEIPEVVEDGATLEANAVKKAVTLAVATGAYALADDTGLEVNALGGAPGVRSARYAGEACDYAANNRKLLAALQGAADREAQFRCVIALAWPNGQAQYVEGVCRGTIGVTARGTNGFGYDPLFIPDEGDRTFAEYTAAEKNACSHRGRALRAAAERWGGLWARADR